MAERWLDPMLATLSKRREFDRGWVFERKLDGIRALGFVTPGRVRLYSRNRLRLDQGYPELTAALAGQALPMVVDGEVVAFRGRETSFELLQQRRHLGRRVRIVYYVFDLLELDGRDVRRLTLAERRSLLRGSVTAGAFVKMTTTRRGRAERLLDEACAKGWEGLIAKRLDAPYTGRRSENWLKLKCSLAQEFVVAGFTDPKGSRVGLGALVLGYHEEGKLRPAGEVGTGFDRATLAELHGRLSTKETDESPFPGVTRRPKGVHWVRPELVAQVEFSEWTRDGRLRHPRFLGLREDKPPAEVIRERPS
ncbi:MAG: non-homologous end-joining DNA ligase [Actinobacteria bacterium]|nr:non-homologous end-joining DNA ligase [Actinomycetota bacterium]